MPVQFIDMETGEISDTHPDDAGSAFVVTGNETAPSINPAVKVALWISGVLVGLSLAFYSVMMWVSL